MSTVDQRLLDEVRRLAALVNAARSHRDLLFVHRLTLAYLHAESGARRESRSELHAAAEVAPDWLAGCVRALADDARAVPAKPSAAARSRGRSGRGSSSRAGALARTAPRSLRLAELTALVVASG